MRLRGPSSEPLRIRIGWKTKDVRSGMEGALVQGWFRLIGYERQPRLGLVWNSTSTRMDPGLSGSHRPLAGSQQSVIMKPNVNLRIILLAGFLLGNPLLRAAP